MPRIRTIKPEFPQSESMGRVSREARLAFIMLWTIADDEGRLRGNSRMLASLLYPYDDDAKEAIDAWLDQLEAEECIIRYAIDSDSYLQICKWREHQKIDKPTRSKLPPPPEDSRGFARIREASSLDLDQDLDQDQGEDLDQDQGGAKPLLQEPEILAPFFALWNEILTPLGYGRADKPTPKRRTALKARLKDDRGFMDTFTRAVSYLAEDSWWRGKARQFTIDLLLCQANRAQELSEKKPSPAEGGTNGKPHHRSATDANYLAQLEARGSRVAAPGVHLSDKELSELFGTPPDPVLPPGVG